MPISQAAKIFDERAEEYDRWYDSSPLFDIELDAIRATTISLPGPGLEIGVGPGRFAQALGIEFGIDPALSPLHLAHRRSIIPINGIGEQLPFSRNSIGTVYIFFSLCFLIDPVLVAKECFRVLKPGGCLMIGFIPAGSEWGKELARKGRENHPYYRHAHFQTIAETKTLLSGRGFVVREAWSTLFQPPAREPFYEKPLPCENEKAGFCVLTANKQGVYVENCKPDHIDN